jgi:alpha-amylase
VAGSLALVLAACTAASEQPDEPDAAQDGAPAPAPEASGPGVGVQMFQWTWDAIGRECTDVLGPAGYGWVLTSPPQEHILGEEWWTAYQPVSYQVESRLGTREQFAAMVDTCADAGVAVVADAVVNHMTAQDSGTGWAGTEFEHYEYPGLYSDAEGDFHHCGLTPNDDIQSYQSAEQVQTCELLNLADLATGTERVRDRVVAYLEDLLSLGVAGFRIDAAKHIAAEDIGAVVDRLPEGTLVMQEVIGAAGEPIQPEDYLDNGMVFDFFYGRDLAGYVGGGSVNLALDLGQGSRALPDDKAVVFVDNHDTERNRSTSMYKDEDEYALANVLMLALDYGTPVVYSGYAFRQFDTGPEQAEDGRVLDAECPDGAWVCQHRWTAIEGMVGWRAATGGAEPEDVWTGRRAVALGRGGAGFVVVNGAFTDLDESFSTSLPEGTYCDVVTGRLVDGACTGEEVVVDGDGTFRAVLGGRTALAVHVEARREG